MQTEEREHWWSVFKLWNNSHPSTNERVDTMRKELDKWDAYRTEHGITTAATKRAGEADTPDSSARAGSTA